MNNPPPSNDRVLVVDDDPVARLLTASVLAQHGFAVTDVPGGAEAIGVFPGGFDCVVLDAIMPGMDGFAACRALRRLPGGEQVPILMLTGLDDDESVAQAYEAGATDFFVKSSQWTLLAQRTRYLLRAARTRRELETSRSKLARAQRIARIGTWDWNPATDAVASSELCHAIRGVPFCDKPVSSREFFSIVHPADLPELRHRLDRMLAGDGELQCEVRVQPPDGRTVHVRLEAEVERDTAGTIIGVHGTSQDITQRKEAEAQIRALANFDNLTGLPNRHMFGQRFGAAIEHARNNAGRLAVLFVDLDRFKQINDTQGHAAGDALLREAADRVNRCVRAGDTDGDVVARLGGDEFVVLLTQFSEGAQLQRVAERILDSLRRPFVINGRDNFISASIGVARFPEDGTDAESLLRNADAAMYAAKGGGRNAIFSYRPELNFADRRRWELEQALHKALERGELVLHYQPQVDVRSGIVPGVEALMRWNHAGRLVPPGDFIPIAEETGLIVPFGEWALETAARQAAAWMREGLGEIRVAVNIPGSHFQRAGFVDMVSRVLREAGIAGHLLELEITETMLMTDISATLATLKALNELDVRLSIDDFGTGYSSLSYLKRFDIDQLKIDRSFVIDLKPESDNETITAAIIAMASALNLEVVAEGVETREQMALLSRRGCHFMQGYLFSRPLPAREITALLEEIAVRGPREEWRQGESARVMSLVGSRTTSRAA